MALGSDNGPMSEHREQVVEVSPGRSRTDRMAEVQAWLVDTGWADGIRTDTDWLEKGGDTHGFGQRARDLFPGIDGTITVAWHEHNDWSAGGDTGPPRCQTCRALADEPTFDTAMEQWTPAFEPNLRCAMCGTDALVGDWDLSESAACANPGFVLDTSSPSHFGGDVAVRVADEIEAAIGGRWRWVHLHL
jgi:hypothetical protein